MDNNYTSIRNYSDRKMWFVLMLIFINEFLVMQLTPQMHIVYNGRGTDIYLSKMGSHRYRGISGKNISEPNNTDPSLIQVIEELGDRASNLEHAYLLLKEVPDDSIYKIIESYNKEEVIYENKDIEQSNLISKEIERLERDELKYKRLLA
ncbi:Hypothetical protein HVR_LOCUS830 [uncultured virus]|nr:Hypothetical protein HVR_LOCUS830 [uncultured virus]